MKITILLEFMIFILCSFSLEKLKLTNFFFITRTSCGLFKSDYKFGISLKPKKDVFLYNFLSYF